MRLRRHSSLRLLTRSNRPLATAGLKITLNSNLKHSLVQHKHRNEHVDPRTLISSVYSLQELDHRNTSCTQTSARTALPLLTSDRQQWLTSAQSTFGHCLQCSGAIYKPHTTKWKFKTSCLFILSVHCELGQPRHWSQWCRSMKSVIT